MFRVTFHPRATVPRKATHTQCSTFSQERTVKIVTRTPTKRGFYICTEHQSNVDVTSAREHHWNIVIIHLDFSVPGPSNALFAAYYILQPASALQRVSFHPKSAYSSSQSVTLAVRITISWVAFESRSEQRTFWYVLPSDWFIPRKSWVPNCRSLNHRVNKYSRRATRLTTRITCSGVNSVKTVAEQRTRRRFSSSVYLYNQARMHCAFEFFGWWPVTSAATSMVSFHPMGTYQPHRVTRSYTHWRRSWVQIRATRFSACYNLWPVSIPE